MKWVYGLSLYTTTAEANDLFVIHHPSGLIQGKIVINA